MYLGHGGRFFEPGYAEPAIANETGVEALEMIAALNQYAGPDFLTYDGNTTNGLWSAGEVAMAAHWGSRAPQFTEGQTLPEIGSVTRVAAIPAVDGGTTPASTLWWDGWTIAANITDAKAEASFVAMLAAIQPSLLEEDGADALAVWLIPGFEPGPSACGVAATTAGGTQAYPMLPYMGVLHTVLGDERADFLQGDEDAMTALEDIEAAYRAAAREEGFLQ